MKTALVIFFCCATRLLVAQSNLTPHFIILQSGHRIEGLTLVYEDPILADPVFQIDGTNYKTLDVKFLSNNNGYFANLSSIHGEKSERYALRIVKGKLDLYEEIDMMIYGQSSLAVYGEGEFDPFLATGASFQYYALRDSSVVKANYSNLKFDLMSNEQSAFHLKRFRNYRWLQRAMIFAGAGLIAANISAQPASELRLTPITALGIVVGGCSYFFETPKEDELWQAANAFNAEPE